MPHFTDSSLLLSCVANLEHSCPFPMTPSFVFDAIIPCHGEDVSDPPFLCSTVVCPWIHANDFIGNGTYDMVVKVLPTFALPISTNHLLSISCFLSSPVYILPARSTTILISRSWVRLCMWVVSLYLFRLKFVNLTFSLIHMHLLIILASSKRVSPLAFMLPQGSVL